jgi:hypothetical protein
VRRDDLNAVWVCANCKQSFIFLLDVEEHKEITGHSDIAKIIYEEFETFDA